MRAAFKLLMAVIKSIFIDVSTPETFWSSAYDTSGNGGRKLVHFNNELYGIARDSTTIKIRKRSISGVYSDVAYISGASSGCKPAIAVTGSNLCVVFNDSTKHYSVTFNPATVTNIDLNSTKVTIDTVTSFSEGLTLTSDSNGNLYTSNSSKVPSYPNSFNIRYSKSNGGVSWDAVTQVTIYNSPNIDQTNPSIVINSLGYPVILNEEHNSTTSYRIFANIYNGSIWDSKVVYNGSAYTQSNPSAVGSPDGNIHVSWEGKDGVDNVYNIRYSKSTDNGATWSTMIKLTSGNIYDMRLPSITANKVNNIFVVLQGSTSTNPSAINILKIIYNGVWSSVNAITEYGGSALVHYPSTCSNYTDFTDPLCIYRDNQASAVKFRGVWTETP